MILVLSVLLSISVSSIGHVVAVSASDFISESYASNVIIWIDRATSLMSYPTNESEYFRYSIPKDTVLNAKGLHKDTSGNYWYEVIYYNTTLYVDAGAGRMVEHVTGDITFKDEQSPTNLAINQGFPIKGKINSVYNKLGTVTAAMYYGSDLSRNPALSSSDNVNGKSYTLDSSTVDYYLHFNKLSAGVYTYAVTVEALSYYIDNGSLKESVRNIVLTSNICSVIDSSNPLPSLHEGIDVSVWNGNIDWAKVATQIEFVIIRAAWECTEDDKFDINAQGCRDNNIPFGVYVYSYAETVQEAINEANAVLNIVSDYDLALPIYFDWEDSVCVNLPASTQAEIVKAFCDTIRAAGRQPGLYTYTWLIPNAFSDSYFNTLPIWVAHYGVSYHGYKGGVHMWQYSCTGTIDGISGNVDLNHMYVELPGENSSDTSYLSQCDYYPSNVMIKTTEQTNMREYPASGYSLMETIPADTSLHATGLYRNTYGNLWYQVEKDGVTGYVGADTVTTTEHLFDDISVINPDMASNLAVGKGYYIGGEISSIYNELSTVRTKVYPAEDIAGTPVIESSYSPHTKEYSLYKSEVDYGLLFGTVPEGYYTYEISVDVDNYYAQDFTTLATNTKNVTLWEKPYTVGDADITPPPSEECTHELVIEPAVAPTCTQSGLTEGSYCSKCGIEFSAQTTIEPKGHNYVSEFFAGTCQEYAYNVFTCSECSDSYKEFVGVTVTGWQETKPEGVPDELIETKTQYRKSEYQTIKNYETSVDGYTLVNREWESQGQKTQECVKSWPEGFSTSNSLYTKYNNTPKQDYTDTYYNKTEVNSEEIIGYLYYHWCRGRVIAGGPYNSLTSLTETSTYPAFHAFFSTEDPSTKTADSDGSVTLPNASCCTDSWWYYYVPVYKQTYTDYKALYTHSIWTAWSEWSDTEYIEAWNRNVETRTLYRYVTGGQLGNHNYVNGSCTVCGESEPPKDMYLFGIINGSDYGYNTDESNIGTYKFMENTLVTTFEEDSYVGVKTEDNLLKYMTNGEQGKVTTVNLFNTQVLGDKANLLYVPKGREVTFTLKNNGNDSYTLSYTLAPCSHESHGTDGRCTVCSVMVEHTFEEGICSICGVRCEHSFVNGICVNCALRCSHSEYTDGICSLCSMACKHSFTDGECTVCGYVCDHSFADGVCTICKLECEHSYENGVCSGCSKVCEHSWQSGVCLICEIRCEHNFQNSICTVCGADCEHSFSEGECTKCGEVCEPHHYSDGYCIVCGESEPTYYLFGYINGADYACNDDYENTGIYKFVDGTLKAKFTEDSYVAVKTWDNRNWYMTNGYPGNNVTIAVLYNTQLLGSRADKLFVPKGREITFTLTDNGDDTFTLMYTVAPCEHLSHSKEGICSDCSAKVSHSFSEGECTNCGYICEHSFSEGVCTSCGVVCNHSYSDGVCTICSKLCAHKFKNGVCVICSKVCSHSFTEGKCTDCGYTCSHSFENGICTECGVGCLHNFEDGICTVCGVNCEHSFENGVCTKCESRCDHIINNGECTVCHKKYTYNLVGYINGKNTGTEENFEQTGEYVFENMKLNLTTTEDSFVFLKTDDNEYWYMADGDEPTLYNTKNYDAEDMICIPGGVQAELTLSFGENDTLILSYNILSCNHLELDADFSCTVCGHKEPVPGFALKYSSFSFEEDLRYSVYFKAENMDEVSYSDMGLAVFADENADGTLDTASEVISGVKVSGDYLVATTNRVMAYELGDTVYFKVYAKLADGTYIYSDLLSYSALRYAEMVLDNPNSKKEEKTLMVALLNYGAEMQKYHNYKTDELVNRNLTKEQRALVEDYSPNMTDKTQAVPAEKTGEFAKSGKGIVAYPDIVLDTDLFGINVNFKAKDIAGDVYVYCWDEAAYEAVDVLTKENALFGFKIESSNGIYSTMIYDFYAKDLDSPVYISFVYDTAEGSRSSGVIAYSVADYFNVQARNEKSEINALAKSAIVYGYYAKMFFKK